MKRRFFIRTIMIGSGSVLIGSQKSEGKISKKAPIKIRMLYNNIGSSSLLSSKWGLAMLIERQDETVLFDTGGDAMVLLENVQKEGIDLSKVSKVVISHNHWDHVNGLDAFATKWNDKLEVYVPGDSLGDIRSNFSSYKLIGVNEPIELNEFAWSTGQLTTDYTSNPIYEQSLIVTFGDTIYVLTGCSHPGIVKIVDKAKSIFPDRTISLVAGGFHMIKYANDDIKEASNGLKKLGVEKIAPSHCTGDTAINMFKDQWGENFVDFNLGQNQISL